jgi:serine/threonine-protein kinase
VNTGLSAQAVTAKFSVPPQCVVPKLEGRTLKTSRHLLGLRHCAVGKVRRATSRKVEKGHVISQQPGPGTSLKHGAGVSLVLSKGSR